MNKKVRVEVGMAEMPGADTVESVHALVVTFFRRRTRVFGKDIIFENPIGIRAENLEIEDISVRVVTDIEMSFTYEQRLIGFLGFEIDNLSDVHIDAPKPTLN